MRYTLATYQRINTYHVSTNVSPRSKIYAYQTYQAVVTMVRILTRFEKKFEDKTKNDYAMNNKF